MKNELDQAAKTKVAEKRYDQGSKQNASPDVMKKLHDDKVPRSNDTVRIFGRSNTVRLYT